MEYMQITPVTVETWALFTNEDEAVISVPVRFWRFTHVEECIGLVLGNGDKGMMPARDFFAGNGYEFDGYVETQINE